MLFRSVSLLLWLHQHIGISSSVLSMTLIEIALIIKIYLSNVSIIIGSVVADLASIRSSYSPKGTYRNVMYNRSIVNDLLRISHPAHS